MSRAERVYLLLVVPPGLAMVALAVFGHWSLARVVAAFFVGLVLGYFAALGVCRSCQ